MWRGFFFLYKTVRNQLALYIASRSLSPSLFECLSWENLSFVYRCSIPSRLHVKPPCHPFRRQTAVINEVEIFYSSSGSSLLFLGKEVFARLHSHLDFLFFLVSSFPFLSLWNFLPFIIQSIQNLILGGRAEDIGKNIFLLLSKCPNEIEAGSKSIS